MLIYSFYSLCTRVFPFLRYSALTLKLSQTIKTFKENCYTKFYKGFQKIMKEFMLLGLWMSSHAKPASWTRQMTVRLLKLCWWSGCLFTHSIEFGLGAVFDWWCIMRLNNKIVACINVLIEYWFIFVVYNEYLEIHKKRKKWGFKMMVVPLWL